MAVFNEEQYLSEAIESILSQTYPNIELIIVNDASTDGTEAIINNLQDSRVKAIHLQNNSGAAHALNVGIEHARGEWIAIHDADDVSYPNRIEKQVHYINEHPEIIGVGSYIECILGWPPVNSSDLRAFESIRNHPFTSGEISSALTTGCPLTHGTVMFSKKAFLKAGQYDPSYKIAYDYDLWTRLIDVGQIENIPEVLYKYRRHSDSLSSENVAKTYNELYLSFTKYIRNRCFPGRSSIPSVVIFGRPAGWDRFSPKANQYLNVIDISYKNNKRLLRQAIRWLNQGGIDGVIILQHFNGKDKLSYHLERYGFEFNKNLFVF